MQVSPNSKKNKYQAHVKIFDHGAPEDVPLVWYYTQLQEIIQKTMWVTRDQVHPYWTFIVMKGSEYMHGMTERSVWKSDCQYWLYTQRSHWWILFHDHGEIQVQGFQEIYS